SLVLGHLRIVGRDGQIGVLRWFRHDVIGGPKAENRLSQACRNCDTQTASLSSSAEHWLIIDSVGCVAGGRKLNYRVRRLFPIQLDAKWNQCALAAGLLGHLARSRAQELVVTRAVVRIVFQYFNRYGRKHMGYMNRRRVFVTRDGLSAAI